MTEAGMQRWMDEAWAAGLYDGEGSSHFRVGTRAADGKGYKNGCQVKITIQQNDREVLDKFQRIVGVGRVYGPYIRKGVRNPNPYYAFQCHTIAEVGAVYECVRRFIGTIKYNQLRATIEAWEAAHGLAA